MSVFKKLGKWTKKNVGKIATIAAPLAGLAVGLVAPGAGAAIGKVVGKIGGKIKTATGIADGKPGVFGIGDGLPGVFGVGTGKGKERRTEELIEAIKVKLKLGEPLTSSEKEAYETASADMKKEGINPLILIGGGLLALFALKK